MTKEKVFISEADQYLLPRERTMIFIKNWARICRRKMVCRESISGYGHQMQHR